MTPRVWAALVLGILVTCLVVMGAVLVPWRGTLPAPRADQLAALRSLPTDSVAKGRALHAALRPASYSAMVLGLAVALGLGLTPAGARLVARCASPFGGGWVAQAVVGGLVVIFVGSLVTLPLTARRQAILRHYGLSTQSWGGWVVDLLKGYAITAVLGGLLLVGFYALTRYVPRWWWAWASAGAAVLVIVFAFVFPILIEPIFNKFTPMPDGPLRTDLITMAAHDGVPVRDVLVADASRRTRAVNAYVSGFGATRRIVVYDTLLEQASPAEVRSVVAHELGHARDNDVLSGAAIGAVGAAAGVIAVYLIGSWPGLLKRAGVGGLGDPRSVALLLALAALAGLIGGPVGNLATRKIEARADAHALTITGDPATFEAMQARLSAVNLADPDPNRLEYLLFATHPSTVERMAEARAYARSHRSGA